MEEEKKQETNVIEKVTEEVDKSITRIMQQGVQTNNVDFLYKMIDIKKDIAEIKKEEQEMMYGNYVNYGRDSYGEYSEGSYNGGRRRDSRGRYMEGSRYNESGRYSERGKDSKYRGHEMIDEMDEYYGNYMEEKEYGNYGGAETMKSLEYMLESVVDFIAMLKKEATNQEEINLIKKYTKKINEM
jgi:hypothetical protein